MCVCPSFFCVSLELSSGSYVLPPPFRLAKEPSKDNVIIITMELCDYDLDNLIKQSPFGQEEVVQFLYQLG